MARGEKPSRQITAFMDQHLEHNDEPNKRTAKSLRSTGAQLVEQETGGSSPHVVDMYLGHADRKMARHYRVEELTPLKMALQRVGKRLGVG